METLAREKSLLKILGEKVVNSGELYIKKKKLLRTHWERFYGILTKEFLTICENKNSKEGIISHDISKFEYVLPDDKVADEEYCFVITYEERHRQPLLFACDREVTRDTWIDDIRETITMCKKFSADSAYASGGSISSRQGERTSMYSAIDELKITSTEEHRGELLTLSATVKFNLDNQTDSGFINVRGKTLSRETRPKAIYGSEAIDPRMNTLKLPIAETSGASSDISSVDDDQDGYENDDIIKEVFGVDVNTLRKMKVTLSNKQADSGFIKVKQNTDETRLKATYGSKAIDPRMDTLKLPLSESGGARIDICSVYDDQDGYENDDIIKDVFGADVNTLRKNKGMKMLGEKTVKKCNQSTESDMEMVDSNETEELALRSTSNSPCRFEISNRDSDQIYENVTNADDSKRFKAVEYMCSDRNNKNALKQMPVGTFCVRPGLSTKQELAVTVAEGSISVFRIYEREGYLYLRDTEQFSSLDDLINYYRDTTLPSENFKLTLMRGFTANPLHVSTENITK